MPFDKNGRWVPSDETQAILDERSWIEDVHIGAKAGIRDAGEETLQMAKAAADWAIEVATPEDWDWGFDDNRNAILPEPYRPVSGLGKFTEEATQFGVGIFGAGKIKYAGKLGRGFDKVFLGKRLRGTRQGAVGAFIVSNPYEERLSDFIQSYPHLENPLTEYLDQDDDDGFWEGKLKAGMEDAFIGAGFDAVIAIAKGVKRLRKGEAPEKVEAEVAEQVTKAEAKVSGDEAAKAQARSDEETAILTEQKALDDHVAAGGADTDALNLTASKNSARKRIIQALKDSKGNPEKALKSIKKNELLVLAKQVGATVKTSDNKKTLYDKINAQIMKGERFDEAGNPTQVATATLDDFGYRQDNPTHTFNPDYAANKQKIAESNAEVDPKMLSGPQTAFLGSDAAKPMFLDTEFVATLKGANDEVIDGTGTKFKELKESVAKDGWDPDQQGNKVLIGVNHKGEAFIMEGNNRAAFAKENGVSEIKVEVKYYNGAEDVAGPYSPENIIKNAKLNDRTTSTLTFKSQETGVQVPKPAKVDPKSLKMTKAEKAALKKDPSSLSNVLKKSRLYNPKTWNADQNVDALRDSVGTLIKQTDSALKDVKGTQTWNDVSEATAERVGDLLDLDNDQLANIVTNYSKATEDATVVLSAVESIVKKQFEDVFDMVSSPKFINDRKYTAETLEALESTHMLLQSVQGQETAFGRALNLRKKGVINLDELDSAAASTKLTDTKSKELDYLFKSYGDAQGLEAIRDIIKNAGRGNYKAIKKAVDKTQETTSKKLVRSLVELFRSMILFNTKTHVTNILSGGIETALRPIEGWMGATFTREFFTAENRMARQFFLDQLEGLFHSADAAAVLTARAFKKEKNILDTLGKVDDINQQNKITSDYWPEAKGTALGGLLDYTGKATRGSLRLLGAEDEFFKQINYRAKVYAQAKAEARSNGLSGDDMVQFITDEIESAFDASGAAAKNADGTFKYSRALDHAREVTFTSELRKGSFARSLHEMLNKHPMGQMLMPFVRTPTNLIATAVQRTPYLRKLSTNLRERLKSTDPTVVAEAHGKLSTGIMIYTAAAGLVYKGLITGSGPIDPEQNRTWRAAGNQPYSVKINGKWTSYQRMDPNFMPFALIANLNDSIQYSAVITGGRDSSGMELGQEAVVAALLSIVRTVEDKAYFSGVMQMAAALSGENPAQAASMERMLHNYASSFVPPAPQQISEALAYVFQDAPAEAKEAVGLIEKIQRRALGGNQSLPTKHNWLTGQPQINYGSFSGIPRSDGMTDEVMEELVRLNVGFRGPTKRWPQLKFDLKSEELSRYQQLTGTMKIGGKTLLQNLRALQNSQLYAQAAASYELDAEGFNQQVVLTRKIIGRHLSAARAQLLQEFPDLNEEVYSRKAASRGNQLVEFNR